ncbi:nucleotidyl transferase AbiEii/AbiGii toxin family protein [Flavobacterium sp. 1355]|uniref:nucleotidyl transferase AbiEii/AbiGii toxin family protein n=1 Tax=Flavobacterium sp. 1355 TaxID=2806571 RepID=UPI001AE98262|nr:nucleotidyl transferase AbiEii/AbiGii toxin family protein [Flavobacterium sp. 1355]MBP1222978.1 putative nucleotidyltransferase component of viral defense system [Flavobacterium sp. 1355]
MIKEWIAEYDPKNTDDVLSALREIMQEVALAGLSRTDFFQKAAFYGGTALRIFYGLDRFSEDLDFSLLKEDHDFSLEPYFESIVDEFKAVGMQVSIREKEKTKKTNIDSAFLKSKTEWKELVLENIVKQEGIKTTNRTIKIKIEVDRRPPLGFETENKLLSRPFSFYVNCFGRPSLFAGKMHALLFRKWGNRVKGRDWYDFEWYIKNGIPLDLHHFTLRAKDTGDWTEEELTKQDVLNLLREKFKAASFDNIKEDVTPFIKNESVLNIWSEQYFNDLLEKLKFK